MARQQQVKVTRKTARSTRERDETPAADHREIRKDVARVWWPEA